MADSESRRKGGKIDWFCPDPRGVFPLDPPDAFHVPRNLAREMRRRRFQIQCDTQFESVMRSCAQPRSRHNPSWINEQLIQSYTQLHRMGHGHSIEAWHEGNLVGGLYGVQLGGAFFGESMFSRPELGGSNSSKVCLVHLVNHLRKRGFTLLDTQYWNEHLDQFGCVEIPAEEYLRRLNESVRLPVTWGPFEAR
jgi:leucyl/phenylalanyl-tRNA--protein transferase